MTDAQNKSGGREPSPKFAALTRAWQLGDISSGSALEKDENVIIPDIRQEACELGISSTHYVTEGEDL